MKSFKDLYNTRKGETCLIVGNGPSLRDVPTEVLKQYATFGTNRCYLKFVPTYYVAVNPLVLKQFGSEIAALDCMRFIPTPFALKDDYFLVSSKIPLFHYNPWQAVYEGYTVTFVCMQIAFFLGFEKVILLGVDHRYNFEGEPNEERILDGDDPNHFDPQYFKNVPWNNPDLAKSTQAYYMANEAYTDVGRRITNATRDSDLKVFPPESLEGFYD